MFRTVYSPHGVIFGCLFLEITMFMRGKPGKGWTDAYAIIKAGHFQLLSLQAVPITAATMTSAACEGRLDLVRWIVHVTNADIVTVEALDAAASNGHLQVVEFIQEKMLDVQLQELTDQLGTAKREAATAKLAFTKQLADHELVIEDLKSDVRRYEAYIESLANDKAAAENKDSDAKLTLLKANAKLNSELSAAHDRIAEVSRSLIDETLHAVEMSDEVAASPGLKGEVQGMIVTWQDHVGGEERGSASESEWPVLPSVHRHSLRRIDSLAQTTASRLIQLSQSLPEL
ncbi:hypothetical protein DYB30_001620 [Aphanomyces astaci]|uniref:Uncharacterized protein n=1 Tax=Aphanomyces astaci TaxID=112090 RepID=A0A397C624_APHAT|nr:hypothetical protein DYB38_002784 [Aphanomyces astaci]RHY39401.1 hypothetical protein DYB30_001620 [Aphanomyces astaci]RHZ15515.1 hypothetical protein DYB31_005972 [Aphanomyces astaci]RHZ35071.1 hypothetical protein DYB26_004467 [Aphanomyces astaci]